MFVNCCFSASMNIRTRGVQAGWRIGERPQAASEIAVKLRSSISSYDARLAGSGEIVRRRQKQLAGRAAAARFRWTVLKRALDV